MDAKNSETELNKVMNLKIYKAPRFVCYGTVRDLINTGQGTDPYDADSAYIVT